MCHAIRAIPVCGRLWVRSAAFAALTLAAVGSAHAGCGDRPGTPNNVTMVATSPHSVEVSWRNTTFKGMNRSGSTSSDPTGNMYFDMYFRNGQKQNIGKDLTGTGPYQVNYGMVSSHVFDNLSPNSAYCFALRARTRGGTQGCISAVTSNWACATTLMANAKPIASPPKPGQQQPVISLQGGANGSDRITGHGFLPNAPVTIRVTNRQLNQVFVETIGGRRITSTPSGTLDVTLAGFCKIQGDELFFTANDGRPNPADKATGTLWSNAATTRCN